MDDAKWQKLPIGKFHGYSLYIELPPTLTGKGINAEWHQASEFIEQAFRNEDFLDDMRQFFTPSK